MRRRAVPRHPSIVKLDMLHGKQVGHLRRKPLGSIRMVGWTGRLAKVIYRLGGFLGDSRAAYLQEFSRGWIHPLYGA